MHFGSISAQAATYCENQMIARFQNLVNRNKAEREKDGVSWPGMMQFPESRSKNQEES
jgi:hypothetical protein